MHWPAWESNAPPPHRQCSPEPYLKVIQSHDVFMFQFLGQKPKFLRIKASSPTTLSPYHFQSPLTLRILISFPSSVWDLARFFLLMHLTATSRSCF